MICFPPVPLLRRSVFVGNWILSSFYGGKRTPFHVICYAICLFMVSSPVVKRAHRANPLLGDALFQVLQCRWLWRIGFQSPRPDGKEHKVGSFLKRRATVQTELNAFPSGQLPLRTTGGAKPVTYADAKNGSLRRECKAGF